MPGMNSGLNIGDPIVVAAFKHALMQQAIVAAVLFGLLGLVWVSVREIRTPPPGQARPVRALLDSGSEAPARTVLRAGFGLLWVLDGLLQAQPGMAVGLPSQVIQPAAASSPPWVQHLVNWAGTSWSYHPIQAAAAAVWIQIGIGLWLLLARQGRLSRLAGLTGAGWGLVVWVFGEAFGGIFAPGLSWLTGAPGAALCYAAAGVLIALPGRVWQTARTGRLMLAGYGLFLIAMAVLQAWPGRGFWPGEIDGRPGTLTAWVQAMASVPQPDALSRLVSGFASVVRAHGFAINLAAVIALAAIGLMLLPGRPRLARAGLITLAAFGSVVWLLVQDLGLFGGLGTDPNSFIPMLLLAAAGYQALTPAASAAAKSTAAEFPAADSPAAESPAEGAPGPQPVPSGAAAGASWRHRLRPAGLRGSLATASLATVASAGAIGVVLLGAVPMAAAQVDRTAAPILAQAVGGSAAPLDAPAPGFTLTDQDGSRVSLAGLRGKAVLLTFLDPVCVTDCPLIAQEFREAGRLLAGQRSQVELIAVNLNPLYHDVRYIQAFNRQEDLAGVPNWRFLTGTPAQLQPVWKHYGAASETLPAGAMLGHSDSAFVIGPDGRLLQELDFDPGPGTAATVSSFAAELAAAARQALSRS